MKSAKRAVGSKPIDRLGVGDEVRRRVDVVVVDPAVGLRDQVLDAAHVDRRRAGEPDHRVDRLRGRVEAGDGQPGRRSSPGTRPSSAARRGRAIGRLADVGRAEVEPGPGRRGRCGSRRGTRRPAPRRGRSRSRPARRYSCTSAVPSGPRSSRSSAASSSRLRVDRTMPAPDPPTLGFTTTGSRSASSAASAWIGWFTTTLRGIAGAHALEELELERLRLLEAVGGDRVDHRDPERPRSGRGAPPRRRDTPRGRACGTTGSSG